MQFEAEKAFRELSESARNEPGMENGDSAEFSKENRKMPCEGSTKPSHTMLRAQSLKAGRAAEPHTDPQQPQNSCPSTADFVNVALKLPAAAAEYDRR